jgi:hypothetical protein
MPIILTNPLFDVDAYLADGGRLTELIIPCKQNRFWEGSRVKAALKKLGNDEQSAARTRFARLNAFCQCLGDGASDVQVGYKLSEEEAKVAWQASGQAVTNMTDSKPEQPWILQLLQDRKTERFRVALEKIASRATDLDAMSPDQARAALREVIRDASIALTVD